MFNKEASILKTLDSVLNQRERNIELIVVDDGSTDQSLDIVKSVNDARIRIIKQKNRGPSKARNFGVRESKSNIVGFLDGDDLFSKDHVEIHLKIRERFPEVDLSFTSFKMFRNKKNREEVITDRLGSGKSILRLNPPEMRLVKNIHSGSYCVNKSLFLKIEGFNEKLRCWEITDFLLRANVNARQLGISKNITVTSENDTHIDTSLFEQQKQEVSFALEFMESNFKLFNELPVEQIQYMARPLKSFYDIASRSGRYTDINRAYDMMKVLGEKFEDKRYRVGGWATHPILMLTKNYVYYYLKRGDGS